MITTTLIASGFDVELDLGGGWFTTTLIALDSVSNTPIGVTSVEVAVDEPGFELRIFTAVGSDLANIEINDDGSQLTISTLATGITKTIPFGALSGLSGTPVLVKLVGDADHENVIAVLANLKLQVEAQDEEPTDTPVPRGDATAAVSFLPLGKHIAFGMGKATYQRLANNTWHTDLRAEDGTHPLPDAAGKIGDWESASMSASGGKLRIRLEGNVPADSPVIDVIPDPHVTITLIITPSVSNGELLFQIETDTDIDAGLLGDLFAAISGGVLGFVIAIIAGATLGGALIVAGIVAAGLVIVLEAAEYIAEGIVQKRIRAKIDGAALPDILCNQDGIVQIATPPASEEETFDLSFLSAIPSSIVLETSRPAGESLFRRSLLVKSLYDDLAVDADGFAAAGLSAQGEKFLPDLVSLVEATYVDEELVSLTFERSDAVQQVVTFADAIARGFTSELSPPFKLFIPPPNATFRIPEGQIACVCLNPVAIERDGLGVVKAIEFENGIRLLARDAIALQDVAGLIVTGFQLIHPRDYHAYYRAKADSEISNNFEELPGFA
jgi:hypothetical protein